MASLMTSSTMRSSCNTSMKMFSTFLMVIRMSLVIAVLQSITTNTSMDNSSLVKTSSFSARWHQDSAWMMSSEFLGVLRCQALLINSNPLDCLSLRESLTWCLRRRTLKGLVLRRERSGCRTRQCRDQSLSSKLAPSEGSVQTSNSKLQAQSPHCLIPLLKQRLFIPTPASRSKQESKQILLFPRNL